MGLQWSCTMLNLWKLDTAELILLSRTWMIHKGTEDHKCLPTSSGQPKPTFPSCKTSMEAHELFYRQTHTHVHVKPPGKNNGCFACQMCQLHFVLRLNSFSSHECKKKKKSVWVFKFRALILHSSVEGTQQSQTSEKGTPPLLYRQFHSACVSRAYFKAQMHFR